MKRRPQVIGDRVKLLGLFNRVSPEEMESARVQALKYLESTRDEAIEDETRNIRPVRAARRKQWLAAVAAAAAIAIAVVLPTRIVQSAPAILEDASGSRKIQYGEVVRPTGEASTMLAMADGARVELRSESELSLERSIDGGVRIVLNRGGVIVNAAGQHDGSLYVMTRDMMVSVVGAVSFVKTEEEGSRVAAIGGEVRVQQGAAETKLRPGEQVTTNPRFEWVPVTEELSWSRQAVVHVAMLQQAAATIPSQRSNDKDMAFEVETIRPAAPVAAPGGPQARGGVGGAAGNNPPCSAGRGGHQLDPRRLNIRNATAREIVAMAYGRCGELMGNAIPRLSGGPEWVGSDRWDIQALIPEGSADSVPNGGSALTEFLDGRSPKIQKMLQTLLENRFKLVVRHQMKEMSAYSLTVAPGGPKFNGLVPPAMPAGATYVLRGMNGETLVSTARGGPQGAGAAPGLVVGGVGIAPPGGDAPQSSQSAPFYRISLTDRCTMGPCGRAMFGNSPMSEIANRLAAMVRRPVFDRTSIQNTVALTLEWPITPVPYVEGQVPPGPSAQDLSKALEAVGLLLKEDPKGTSIETFVIEHIEKPSGN